MLIPAAAFAQGTRRISVDATGGEPDGPCGAPALSVDARFVAFESSASDLVGGDTNSASDVFVLDRLTGALERASVGTGGAQGEGASRGASLSHEGRFVAFSSRATFLGALGAGETIFVRDRQLATTTLVEPAVPSHSPAIGGDGRWLAYVSENSALVPADANAARDVFVRDLSSGAFECASVGASGTCGNNASDAPAISTDGRFVAFQSHASDLVPGDTNAVQDVFVRDRLLAATIRVNVDAAGAQSLYGLSPSLSADGRFVAFSNLGALTGTIVGDQAIYVRDLVSGQVELASVDSAGLAASSWSSRPVLSPDGRFVAFVSRSSDLAPGDTNGSDDVFVHDRLTRATHLSSRGAAGASGNGPSPAPALEARGLSIANTGTVAFSSAASDLVGGDGNGVADLFAHDETALVQGYCTAGTSSTGCVPVLGSSGVPSATASSGFVVTASALNGLRSGLFFYGTSGVLAVPWPTTSSYLCVEPPTQRTSVQSTGGQLGACDGSMALDWNAFRATHPLALGAPFALPTRIELQAWYRDPATVKGTQLTAALDFVVAP